MPNYIRRRVKGGTYFFTVNLADRQSTLLVDRFVDLQNAVRTVQRVRPFVVEAWVVLPDHLHCVVTLPEGDSDYSTRWNAIKGIFTRRVRASRTHDGLCIGDTAVRHGRTLRHSHIRRREAGIWQRRFWEHTIRDETDYNNHVRYCWFNPVKHGLVERAEDWEYSLQFQDW